MITITRRQARRLRGVFRRSILGIGHRGPVPPLVLRAQGNQLCLEHRYAALAVAHVEPGVYRPHEPIALPLDALADCEGRDDSPVVLEAVAPDKTVVRWDDHGIPQTREYAVPALATLASFPEPPAAFEPASSGLLDALAEATLTATDDSARYALNCVQLRGNTHEVVATDGRQMLVQNGYRFPWDGDVLVQGAPVFACRDLPRDLPAALGKTDAHVVLRVGPWTLFCAVQTDARFPNVDRVLPGPDAATTRWRLDPDDAAFLGQALDRLPGKDDHNAPVTVELNGRVTVRARGADQAQPTEVVLARSRCTGASTRFTANRAFLARALRFGFAEFALTDAEAPVVCRDGRRVYAFQPLSQESALAPTDDVTRIESTPPPPGPVAWPAAIPKASPPMSEPPRPTNGHVHRSAADGPGPAPDSAPSNGVQSLIALIQDAEALHEALGDARARAQRLVVALRRQRKRDRLMSSTLAALKQLRLQEVGE